MAEKPFYTITEAAALSGYSTAQIRRIRRNDKKLSEDSENRFFKAGEWIDPGTSAEYRYSIQFTDGQSHDITTAATAWLYRGSAKAGIRFGLIAEQLPAKLSLDQIEEITEIPGERSKNVRLAKSAVDRLSTQSKETKRGRPRED